MQIAPNDGLARSKVKSFCHFPAAVPTGANQIVVFFVGLPLP